MILLLPAALSVLAVLILAWGIALLLIPSDFGGDLVIGWATIAAGVTLFAAAWVVAAVVT